MPIADYIYVVPPPITNLTILTEIRNQLHYIALTQYDIVCTRDKNEIQELYNTITTHANIVLRLVRRLPVIGNLTVNECYMVSKVFNAAIEYKMEAAIPILLRNCKMGIPTPQYTEIVKAFVLHIIDWIRDNGDERTCIDFAQFILDISLTNNELDSILWNLFDDARITEVDIDLLKDYIHDAQLEQND
jgi:hypothetical protein